MPNPTSSDGWLSRPVNALLAPHLEAMSARLSRTEGLTAAERDVVDHAWLDREFGW